ncbi:RNA polymerase sigma factor [Streptomyces koyangensis]|uniref:RNA polymerase sigma factor n=1 Tax=Streptomyces koyangensis TaxID=188770 RepID=UPI003D026F2A
MDRIDAQPLTAASADRLDRLFRLYNARLLGFAATRTRDYATAEDVVSETWLRAAVSLSQLRADDAHAYGWLRSIAFRAAVDQYRPRSASEKPEDWTDALASRALPAVPAAEAVTDVFALDVLSVPQCAAVKLAAQGLSNTRIARQLGKSRQAVQQNLASSARRLRASVALAG